MLPLAPGRRLPSVVLLTLGLVVLLMLWRLRYGVALTDESAWIAMPYRFVLGDVPFVDELWIQQTAGLLVVPLVWLWVHVIGSSEGIVLFTRAMWFALAALTSFAAYSLFRRLLPPSLAATLSVVYLAFVPFTIPNLGYNTLGSALLTIGLALLAIQILDSRDSPGLAAVSGVCHGMAVVAYPTLAVAVCVAAVAISRLGEYRRRRLLGYLSGLASIGVLFALLVLAVGPSHLLVALAFTNNTPPSPLPYLGGLHKLAMVLEQVKDLGLPSLVMQAGLLALALGLWDRKPMARMLVLALPFAGLLPLLRSPTVAVQLWAPLFGVPALLLLLREQQGRIRLVSSLIAPVAIAAGAAMAYASMQGFFNAGTGMAPILLVALPLVFSPALEGASRGARHGWTTTGSIALVLLLVAVNWLGAYESGGVPPFRMQDMVRSGPWKYMFGTRSNVEVAEAIQDDVNRYVRADSRVLFYCPIYGGYLATSARPAAPSVFLEYSFNAQNAPLLRKHSRAPLPDFVFMPNPQDKPDAWGNTLVKPFWYQTEETQYRRIVHRAQYDVFQRAE